MGLPAVLAVRLLVLSVVIKAMNRPLVAPELARLNMATLEFLGGARQM